MIFKKHPEIIFVTSTLEDGNMDFRFGEQKEVSKNRKQFFQKHTIDPKQVIEVNQVHGNKVLCHPNLIGGDGLITNQPGIFLIMKVADCHQIGFYDQKNKAVGLAHAGWRGLEKGILQNMVKKMQKNFRTKPQDLIIQFGPSIGPCCYHMDIREQAENRLINLRILKQNIDNPKVCTYHTDRYFSHRKSTVENIPEGRFITVIGIKR